MRNGMHRKAGAATALVVALLTACSGSFLSDPGPGKRIQMTLTRDTYQSGDTATVLVKNISLVTLDYVGSFCLRALQRYQSGEWSTVSPPPDGCTLQIGLLGPGQTVPLTFYLSSDVSTGLYRLTIPSPTPLRAQGPDSDVTSPSFSVNSVAFGQP